MQDKPSKPRKRAVNLSIDAALVEEAKAAGTNLSALLETALREALKAERTRRWQEENRDGIQSSNRYIDEHGLPLAKYRTW